MADFHCQLKQAVIKGAVTGIVLVVVVHGVALILFALGVFP